MSKIAKQDTNGVKPLLEVGELGYDNYPAGGDVGRVYVGTGSSNIMLAKKIEVVDVDGKVDTHIGRTDNPHSVTKAQVGLGNVDNTADADKNVLSAAKWTTARTISLTGDVTGSTSIDGSANVSITATVADDSHNHIISNVDGLQVALDSKANQNNTYTKTEVDNALTFLMHPVDTIDDLRNETGKYKYVYVTGYHTKDDGAFGSNMFIWDDDSTETDNGGTVIKCTTVATGRYKLKYSGAVNVKWFGAKGDGVTDDTVAIQAAIDFCMSGGSDVGSAFNSGSKKLEVEAGIYLISSELIIYQSNFILSGIGVPTFIGTSSLSNEEFIIKTGLTKSGTFVSVYNIVIENIKFERKTSNPYKSDYNSTTFGSGASYTFINSCNGVYFGDSHFSYIKNCSFIGLRLAIKQMGSWLSYIEDCTFSYNDRHIYGANSIYGANDSNNANVISRCSFGSSIMVGGVYLEQYDDLTFENIDYEQSHQTPFVLRQCRNVQFNGYLHLEFNSKYFGNVSSPSYIGDSSSFMPLAGEGETYVGKAIYSTNIICGVSKNVVINNISNRDTTASTLVVSYYGYNDIILNSPSWFSHGASLPTNDMVIVHKGDAGFILNNVDTVYWHKISTDERVKVYGELTDNKNYSCPKVWYIDTVNGSADIPTHQMSELNPLSASNFICLPQNNSYTFNINNVGGWLRLPLNYEDINIIGLGDAKAIKRIISYGSCRNLNITGIVMSDTIYNYGSIDTLKITSCTASYDSAPGFLAVNRPTNTFIYSSSFTNSNALNYTMVVENQKLFVKDTYCNKPIEGRNGSLIYYKNVTGAVPYSNATVYLSKIESM